MSVENTKKISFLGYTLVELMIVMSIIGVLVGFLLGAVLKAKQKAKLTSVHVLMDSVAAALRMYQDAYGDYPPNNTINRHTSSIAGTSAECLYYYLGATYKSGVNASIYAGPFMKFSGREINEKIVTACDIDGDGSIDDSIYEIVDPWGRPLHYGYPPTHNLNSYDLYSDGPNKVDNSGGSDDINNWE